MARELRSVSRRGFMGTAGVAVGAYAGGAGASSAGRRGECLMMKEHFLSDAPSFCAHEHWGSIDAIGRSPEGYRADVECGASPKRRVDLFDILLDPYFRGNLGAAGVDPDLCAQKAGEADFRTVARQDVEGAWALLEPALAQQELTGTYQCILRGLEALYGAEMKVGEAAEGLAELSAAIGARYADIFAWYREAMTRARFSQLIRPVHPEYYFREESEQGASAERAFTRTVMRIDPLLDFWKPEHSRREGLAKAVGIDPVDAESWRAFIKALFDRGGASGGVGIKQLQAYGRCLDFAARQDDEVVWRGALSKGQVRVFEDWVVNVCCAEANARGWPHQVHVGTHNLDESMPLPLGGLAHRYPDMKLVMLHCWPFVEEAGWLAKHCSNVYIDTCWQPVLNPAFLAQSLGTWLNYVPLHKIMCSHDATSVEMAVGSATFTRAILAQLLDTGEMYGAMDSGRKREVGHALLHNNAAVVYGLGETA